MTDFELQQQLAQRRLQQYEQQAQTQAPQGRMVGRTFVAPNALEYIAAGLRGYGGIKGQSQVQQELQDIGAQRQKAVADALRNFGQASQGQAPAQLPAAEQQAYGQMGDMSPTVGAVKPDMNAAYAGLLNAPDAALRQAGMQGMISMADQQRKQADQQRMMQILQNSTPQQAIASGVPPEMVKSYYESRNYGRDKVEFKDVGGKLVPVTEFGDTPQGVRPLDKTGNPFSDMLVMGPDGTLTPNAPLVQVKREIAVAGRPTVNVTNKIENKAAENIAGQVGPILKDSATAAEGAVRTLDAANRIISAVDSGNIVAGPLANTRVTARQAAQLLGIGGATNAEVLRNTRDVIRGLAEMTLQGRKQMSGQGAITESESKLAEKATSGDITDLTPAEIRQLANASRRASQFTIQSHQRKIEAANKLPGTQGLTPFFSSPQVPDGGALDFNALP